MGKRSCLGGLIANARKQPAYGASSTPTNFTASTHIPTTLNAMNNRLKSRVQRPDPATIAFAAIPAALYLPVLYYSLNTPFALVDDYVEWVFLRIFDHFNHWLYIELHIFGRSNHWLDVELLGRHWQNLRYHPFWELYMGAAWKVFGPTPWLHYLARWVAHFCSVFAFAAAFLCFQRRNVNGDSATTRRIIRLLPLTALVYLWIFFPNQPAARLAMHELHVVFFLGICAWVMASMIRRQSKPQNRRSELLTYAAFCVGFCGIAWSKESNIAAALWLLLSYYALLPIAALRRQAGSRISAVRALKGISVWKALGGLPLIAVFLHTLLKVHYVSQEGGYGTGTMTPKLLADNAVWIASELFQVHTSLIITAGLAFLSAVLLLFVAVNIVKKRFSDELIFTLFLMGMFASLYLILCASWTQILRYWYILIPPFTTLLAFSIKFILEFAAAQWQPKRALGFTRIPPLPTRNLAAYALIAFIAFFVCCNYYNFLYQTIVQHIARHNDAKLLAETTRLLDQDQYIQVLDAEYPNGYELITYFNEYLPWFYGREYDLRAQPPQEASRPHYTIRLIKVGQPDRVSRLSEAEKNYRALAYAYRLADFLQMGSPHRSMDSGGMLIWQIYDDKRDWIWQNGETLDIRQLVADAGSPMIRADFDVYLNNRRLIYINDSCSADALGKPFFLGVFPVDNADLPEARRPHGFDNLDFDFADHGFSGGDRCFAVRDLPEYPIKRIHTGQFIIAADGFRHIWEEEVILSQE